jgi:hypothetical protein
MGKLLKPLLPNEHNQYRPKPLLAVEQPCLIDPSIEDIQEKSYDERCNDALSSIVAASSIQQCWVNTRSYRPSGCTLGCLCHDIRQSDHHRSSDHDNNSHTRSQLTAKKSGGREEHCLWCPILGSILKARRQYALVSSKHRLRASG